jgi:hypothetical protein
VGGEKSANSRSALSLFSRSFFFSLSRKKLRSPPLVDYEYKTFHDYSKKFEIVAGHAYRDQDKLFDEKNRRQKILRHYSFKYTYRRNSPRSNINYAPFVNILIFCLLFYPNVISFYCFSFLQWHMNLIKCCDNFPCNLLLFFIMYSFSFFISIVLDNLNFVRGL